MRFFLGVDGGQTKTLALIGDEEGNILGKGKGGPANHIREKGGRKRFREAITRAVEEALRTAGLKDVRFTSAYLGISGANEIMYRIAKRIIKAKRITLEGDALLALSACTLGREGAVIIAGGGSVAFAKDREGRYASAGGWGYFMGDEGSAFWLAQRAINICTKAVDGRGPHTRILPHLLTYFKVESLQDLHRLIYSGQLTRSQIAGSAQAVLEAAREGDEVALSLYEEAGRELALSAISAIKKLSMEKEEVVVGLVGGVFSAGELIIEPLKRKLLEEVPKAKVTFPILPPEATALLLAMQNGGITISDDLVGRLKESLKKWSE